MNRNEEVVTNLNINRDGDNFYCEIMRKFMNDRTLVINEEITTDLIDSAVMRILDWNIEDACLQAKHRKPITIIINSGGGDVFTANGLSDVMLASTTPIRVIGVGFVCSAAYLIYLAGGERYAFPNTSFLQHDGETSIENSSNKAKDTMAFFDDMSVRTKQYIIERTGMDEEFYDKYADRELWFYPDKGKELGVVHKIIGEDVKLLDVFGK